MSRYIGRANLRKRLEPLDGGAGRVVYGGGEALIETPSGRLVVRPPFGLAEEGERDPVDLGPLFAALAADRVVAVLLVRLGGYAVGVYEGDRLVASKVGTRFVKGRHKAGGSSSNRFRRRREEQAKTLVEEAAATAATVLAPWRERVEFVAFGGDRAAIRDTLAARRDLDWLAARAIERFFTVEDPRRRVLDRLAYDLYAAELVEEDLGPGAGSPPA